MILSNKTKVMDKNQKVIAEIEPGKRVCIETINAFGDTLSNVSELDAVLHNKDIHHHPLTGPILVKGAKAGNYLKVQIHKITCLDPIQSLSKSAGVEPKDTPTFGDRAPAKAKIRKDSLDFMGFELPLRPMLGIIGTAPNTGFIKAGHAKRTGGNLDIPFVCEGASVYLPVDVDGAFLYLGDAHALQGYGELNGIALETSAHVELTVDIIKPDKRWYEMDHNSEKNHLSGRPILIAGKEPVFGVDGICIVGVSENFGDINNAISHANRDASMILPLLNCRLNPLNARNIITLIGNVLPGQAASKTAESIAMVFFRFDDIKKIANDEISTNEGIMQMLFIEEH